MGDQIGKVDWDHMIVGLWFIYQFVLQLSCMEWEVQKKGLETDKVSAYTEMIVEGMNVDQL